MTGPLRALVVDDEPLARRRLRALIDDAPGITWCGEAENGVRALQLIEDVEADVLFLDIEMPGMSGLDVALLADGRLQVIFTTAFDQHAVKAFDLQAADYLLKPFSAQRLRSAIERARSLAPDQRGAAQRIFARERGRIVPIPARSIVRLEADGDYVHVHTDDREHLITATLSELHARLDQDTFVRVHRSHVVNMNAVARIESSGGSRLRLCLKNGQSILASRARSKELRASFR